MSDAKIAHWLTHAETEVRQKQKELDDLDSLNLPLQWGEIDIAHLRGELVAALEEHARDVAHWRDQLNQQGAGWPWRLCIASVLGTSPTIAFKSHDDGRPRKPLRG